MDIIQSSNVNAGLAGLVFAQVAHVDWKALHAGHDVERERLSPWGEADDEPVALPPTASLVVILTKPHNAAAPHCRLGFCGPLHDLQQHVAIGPRLLVSDLGDEVADAGIVEFGLEFCHPYS